MTTNNNDILFDDFAAIASIHLSDSSANHSITYEDCSNRLERQTAENLNPGNYGGNYSKFASSYGDCSN